MIILGGQSTPGRTSYLRHGFWAVAAVTLCYGHGSMPHGRHEARRPGRGYHAVRVKWRYGPGRWAYIVISLLPLAVLPEL